jgi:hypothetical protein
MMSSFLQGEPLPDVTTTRTTEQQAPEYYTNYLASLSEASKAPLGMTGAELTAQYDPLQTTGYGQYETAAGAYMPGLTAAQQLARQATGVTPERISQFMDPYQQSVVDEMARLSAQNVQRNVLPQLKAGFVGSGGLGGQRYASALGQGLSDIQLGLQGQQAAALSKGYSDALRAAFDQLSAEREAAGLQAELGALGQELGLTGAESLTKAGAERQAYEQSIIDAPLKTAMNVAQLMRGYEIPMLTSERETGPKPGAYGLSDFEKISGILSLVGAYGGKGTDKTSPLQFAGQGLESIIGQIGKLFPSRSYPYGGADIDVGNVS